MGGPRYLGIPAIVERSEAIADVVTRVTEGACTYPITPSRLEDALRSRGPSLTAEEGPMLDFEKRAVSLPDHRVRCPMRDADVAVERCLECPRLLRAEASDTPRYIVCDGYAFASWLGMVDA